MYGGGRNRLNTLDREWQSKYHYKRRPNIVISDMDSNNTCDRPLVKLLRIYCYEWSFKSVTFEKFQVNFKHSSSKDMNFYSRLLLHFLSWMHLLIYL